MMVTAEDGEKISFEELKKLEPAMQETESTLAIDQLATTITTEAGNGKKVNDATIDFTVANILNKAYQEGGDKLSVLTSLATDMSKEVGGQKFDFYNYLKSSNDLATKYINSDGSFNIPEDPSARAEYAKNFESDFKGYLRGTMQTVRDENIAAFEKEKTDAEQAVFDRESKQRMDEIRLRYSFTGNSQGTDRPDLLPLLKQIDKGVEANINDLNNIPIGTNTRLQISPTDVEGQYNIAVVGVDAGVSGTFGKAVVSDVVDINDKGALKNTLFNLVSGNENTWRSYVGDKWNPNMYKNANTGASEEVEEETNTNPFISDDVNKQIEDNWPDFNAMAANQLEAFANKIKNAKVIPGSRQYDDAGNEIESSYEIDGVTLTGKQKDVFYNNLVGTEDDSGLISRTTATENNAENLNRIDRMLVNAQIEKPGNNFLTIDSEGKVFPIGSTYSNSAIKRYDAVLTNLDNMKAGDITGGVKEKN